MEKFECRNAKAFRENGHSNARPAREVIPLFLPQPPPTQKKRPVVVTFMRTRLTRLTLLFVLVPERGTAYQYGHTRAALRGLIAVAWRGGRQAQWVQTVCPLQVPAQSDKKDIYFINDSDRDTPKSFFTSSFLYGGSLCGTVQN